MSIVKLKKITLYALSKNMKVFLNQLQDLGVMHVISLTNKTEQIKIPEGERKAEEALQFLLSAPLRRGQVHAKKTFDAHHVKTETLKLKNSLQKLSRSWTNMIWYGKIAGKIIVFTILW
jgi:vacuolar-type H+-ATPase subunit I/STV1